MVDPSKAIHLVTGNDHHALGGKEAMSVGGRLPSVDGRSSSPFSTPSRRTFSVDSYLRKRALKAQQQSQFCKSIENQSPNC